MANVEGVRQDGSKVERDVDGYILNPRSGDVDEDLTCIGCDAENVRVTYSHTEWWGNPERPTGLVEFWYCDPCSEEQIRR